MSAASSGNARPVESIVLDVGDERKDSYGDHLHVIKVGDEQFRCTCFRLRVGGKREDLFDITIPADRCPTHSQAIKEAEKYYADNKRFKTSH